MVLQLANFYFAVSSGAVETKLVSRGAGTTGNFRRRDLIKTTPTISVSRFSATSPFDNVIRS